MPKAALDWDALFDEWVLVIRPKDDMTQKQYAISKGVTPEYLSKRFTEIKLERTTNLAKTKMGEVMLKSLAQVDQGLDDMALSDIDPATKLRAANESFKSTADRLGLSPQANIISIQNSAIANAQNVLTIQPMFASDQDANDFKQLLGGEDEKQD